MDKEGKKRAEGKRLFLLSAAVALSALVLSACAPKPTAEVPQYSPPRVEDLRDDKNTAALVWTGNHLLTMNDRVDSKTGPRDFWKYIADLYNRNAPVTTKGGLTPEIIQRFNPEIFDAWENHSVMPLKPVLKIPSFPIVQEDWLTFPCHPTKIETLFSIGLSCQEGKFHDVDALAFQHFNEKIRDSYLIDGITLPNTMAGVLIPVYRPLISDKAK